MEHIIARRGNGGASTERTKVADISMSGATEEEDAFSEDVATTFEDFEIEGISAEELKYWSQLAPNDQKLVQVIRVDDSPDCTSPASSKSLGLVMLRYKV